MIFWRYNNSVDHHLQKFDEAACDAARPLFALIKKKLALCDFELLLVPSNFSNPDYLTERSLNNKNIIGLNNAWAILRGEGLTNMEAQKKAWSFIDDIGGTVTAREKTFLSPILRRFQNDPTGKRFFVLLTGNETDGLPVYEMNALCDLWQLEHGFIPIHASGVIHREKLFLFGGVSGAGKSTISNLSVEIGDKILDEDQLLIHLIARGQYGARAWGYSIETCDAPLYAIFKIVQGERNRIIPLKSSQIAQFLMEQIYQVTGKHLLSDDLVSSLFKQVSDIVRNVPGNELHFQKTPEFWKLVDERFAQ